MLCLIDEYTHEALAIRVKRRLNAQDVLESLADAMIWRRPPDYIRSDNGPEFIAKARRTWIGNVGTQTAYIEPGSPWENGYCESFNSKLRDELLNGEIFYSLRERSIRVKCCTVFSLGLSCLQRETAMDDDAFAAFLGQVGALNPPQREALLRVLSLPAPTLGALLDSGGPGHLARPHCTGTQVSSWGSAHGLRRYRCRGCRRSFNALTGTPLARLRRKQVWLGFAAALQQTLSVRKAAKACDIAVSTTFRWRHRFLATPTACKPAQLSGIVEADETFFRRSYKGLRRWTDPAAAAPARPARRRGAPTGRRGTPLDE